jgi:hypothetical protein
MFAYNTDFDYVKIANVSAALVKKWCSLPVTLITDEFGALQAGPYIDNIIIQPTNGTNKRTLRTTHDKETQVIDWKNLNRASVYDLSPYEQTILIDCDYLMFSDMLYELTWTNVEFTCHKDVFDVTGQNCFQSDQRLSQYSIPMLWATVIYFRKSSFSKSVFDMMMLVQENYEYYAKVYGFRASPFRNDFALSIAYHAMSGYGLDELMPWKLNTLSPMTDVVDFRGFKSGQLLYQYKNKGKMYTGISERVDLHVMNKAALTDDILRKIMHYATS